MMMSLVRFVTAPCGSESLLQRMGDTILPPSQERQIASHQMIINNAQTRRHESDNHHQRHLHTHERHAQSMRHDDDRHYVFIEGMRYWNRTITGTLRMVVILVATAAAATVSSNAWIVGTGLLIADALSNNFQSAAQQQELSTLPSSSTLAGVLPEPTSLSASPAVTSPSSPSSPSSLLNQIQFGAEVTRSSKVRLMHVGLDGELRPLMGPGGRRRKACPAGALSDNLEDGCILHIEPISRSVRIRHGAIVRLVAKTHRCVIDKHHVYLGSSKMGGAYWYAKQDDNEPCNQFEIIIWRRPSGTSDNFQPLAPGDHSLRDGDRIMLRTRNAIVHGYNGNPYLGLSLYRWLDMPNYCGVDYVSGGQIVPASSYCTWQVQIDHAVDGIAASSVF